MNIPVFAAQATIDSLAYATEKGVEAAQIQICEQIPVGMFAVADYADEFSLYQLRKRLGMKAVCTFEEFLQRLIPLKVG